MNKEPDSSNA